MTYTRSASLYRWPGTIVKGWPDPSQRMQGPAATTVRPTTGERTQVYDEDLGATAYFASCFRSYDEETWPTK